MNTNHIYSIPEDKIDAIKLLAQVKDFNSYVLLSNGSNNWCDVALWSDKYQNIFLFSMTKDKLIDKRRID